MSKSKRQSICMIGIGLILISGLIFWFSLSLPKVSYKNDATNSSSEPQSSLVQTESFAQSSEQSSADNAQVSETDNYTNSGETDGEADKSYTGTDNISDGVSVTYPLNINTCTAEELMTINGIGETRACAIIQYREYLGGYTSVEQIKNIKGFGDVLYEKISPYLTV